MLEQPPLVVEAMGQFPRRSCRLLLQLLPLKRILESHLRVVLVAVLASYY
jgi:hypothetical protein